MDEDTFNANAVLTRVLAVRYLRQREPYAKRDKDSQDTTHNNTDILFNRSGGHDNGGILASEFKSYWSEMSSSILHDLCGGSLSASPVEEG